MSNAARQARMEAAALAALPKVTREIDWGALDRIAAFAAERRAELGDERWNALNAEWEA